MLPAQLEQPHLYLLAAHALDSVVMIRLTSIYSQAAQGRAGFFGVNSRREFPTFLSTNRELAQALKLAQQSYAVFPLSILTELIDIFRDVGKQARVKKFIRLGLSHPGSITVAGEAHALSV